MEQKQEERQPEYLSDIPASMILKKVESKLEPGKVCVITKDARKYFVLPGARPAARESKSKE